MNEEHKGMVGRYALASKACRYADRNGFTDLEQDTAQGYGMLLCGILVEPQASPLITADVKDPSFFSGIFSNDDNAVPDLTADELDQLRRYIIRGEGTIARPQAAPWAEGCAHSAVGPNSALTIRGSPSPRARTEGIQMGKVDNDRAGKIGDFLFRYMQVRHRFKDRLERPLPSHELATLIQRGKQEFDEIYVEPDANPPIVLDGKADDVFDAIINKKYRAIPFCDPQLVAAWGNYVVGDGPMPRKPVPAGAHAVRTGEPVPNDRAD